MLKFKIMSGKENLEKKRGEEGEGKERKTHDRQKIELNLFYYNLNTLVVM